MSYDHRADRWFALRRTNIYNDFESFASGTFEEMRMLVEITVKLES